MRPKMGASVFFGVLAVTLLTLAPADTADGGVIDASSSAFDARAIINQTTTVCLPIIGCIITIPSSTTEGPINEISAPPGGTDSVVDADLGPFGTASLDEVQATVAINTPDGNAFARATLEGLFFDFSFAHLRATTIESTAHANETNFGISLVGDVSFEEALLTLALSPTFSIVLELEADPAPNTVVAHGVPGVTLVLNEQLTQQTATSASIAVNAIHLTTSALPIGPNQTIAFDIVIGHSQAALTLDPALQNEVPEPSVAVLYVAGVVSTWFATQRRVGRERRRTG